jgi:hypothetical protein
VAEETILQLVVAHVALKTMGIPRRKPDALFCGDGHDVCRNEVEMDRIEYWILDVVVTRYYPLYILTAPNVAEILNRKYAYGQGLPYSILVDAVEQLFLQGYLQLAWWHVPLHTWMPMTDLNSSRPTIEAALKGEKEVNYGLTGKGGSAWESKFHPNWPKYRDEDVNSEPGDTARITAGSLEVINQYVSLVFPSYLYPFIPIPETQVIERISPWQATYWKSLPEGYCMEFNYQAVETEPTPSDTFLKQYRAITQWYDEQILDYS